MADSSDTPQNNFQSVQNQDPDVKQMFKDFVTGGATPNNNEPSQNVGIDDIRAQVSVTITGQTTQNLIKSLNINPATNTIAGTANVTTPSQLAQESRCHAFYRIIGLPVVNSDKSDFYNPGLDIVIGNNITRQVTLERKLRIASNVGAKFEAISQAREEYSAQVSQIFSVPSSIEAGVLSLTSGTCGKNNTTNIRKFAQTFEKSKDPFDFDISKQSYSFPGDISSMRCKVGDFELQLSDFQDPSADPTNDYKANLAIGGFDIMKNHKHIIRPFMVDPRIDFSIWAAESKTAAGVSRRVAIPFVPNSKYLQTSPIAKAERPLIEKIIRDRLAVPRVQDAGTAVTQVVEYVKNSKQIQTISIGGSTIGEIFTGNVFKLSQRQAFAQFLANVQGLISKLVKCIDTVATAQSFYYWLPLPSNLGPEAGCVVRDLPLDGNLDTSIFTEYDQDILDKQVSVVLSGINHSIAAISNTPDPGNFSFSNFKLPFDSSTSDSLGDLNARTQSTIIDIRNEYLTKASESLQIIEMIMGEFSGLGLCDIFAILGALYVIPINDLFGLLDDDAAVRAEVALKQPTDSIKNARTGIGSAMISLADTVNAFYQIMDQMFKDRKNNNDTNL